MSLFIKKLRPSLLQSCSKAAFKHPDTELLSKSDPKLLVDSLDGEKNKLTLANDVQHL